MAAGQCVDYDQTVEDHQSLLVLVRHTGSALSSQIFNRAFEKISRISGIHVESQKRHIVINYRKSYSSDFNSWGDFQAHRKVLGLISIGRCTDQTEFEELFTYYKKLKGEYASSIINSRFIVLGLNTDGTPIWTDPVDDNGNESESKGHIKPENIQTSCDIENDSKSSNAVNNNLAIKSANGTLAPLAEQEEDAEVDNTHNSSLNPVTMNNASSESSTSKNSPSPHHRRQHSNSLTKESSGAEIVFYPNLDKAGDFEERIKEFVTSLYYVVEGKRLDRSFERNDKLSLLCAPFERKDYVGVDTDTKSFRKKCMGRLRKHLGDLCLQASMPGEAILHYNTALDLLKSVNDFMWMAGCLEGLCCSSIILSIPKESQKIGLRRNFSFQTKGSALNMDIKARSGSSYANGLDTLGEMTTQQTLNQDDVIDKFKEAITYYSKFKYAAVIEMETSLKACRFLILHHRYLQASDFLQNMVYINLPSPDDDKIQRYNTLSSLYHQIGFKRKAAFFKRVSGMHCTVPDSCPNWAQCYELLLQCLNGYSLSVNPRDMDSQIHHPKGWPALQNRVLHELVYAAKRSNHTEVAVRHMTLLVHRMLPHISVADQREALLGLSNLTAKCPGTTKSIPLDNGYILPPVSLLSLPAVRSLRLIPPDRHLQPHKIQGVGNEDDRGSSDIFIYTPLSLGSTKADDSRPDFNWVCGDVCEATLQLYNPLVDDLRVATMALITSELETEVMSANPIIPSESKLATVNLAVKPLESGTLKIQGYSTVVCGVKSNCRLRDLPYLKPSSMSEISIQVIPRLPKVTLSCSLPKSSSTFSTLSMGVRGGGDCMVTTGSAVLFAGQSLECVVSLKNTSDVPLENLRVWLETKGDSQDLLMKRMIKWSQDNIEAQLPLPPSQTLCFSVCIHGDSDFLPSIAKAASPKATAGSRGRTDNTMDAKNLEVAVCLEYSGGEGFQAGYCRKCSLGLNLDILPSLIISRWDVQATDSSSHCRLCLDLVNLSSKQMTLHYGRDQKMTVESEYTKRVGMEIARLSPSQINDAMSKKETESNNHVPSMYSSTLPTPDPYSQCLGSGLDIEWTMSSTKASGKVCLDYMKWNLDQLSVLLMSDVRWDICLNGRQCSTSLKPRFDIGQVLTLVVSVETSQDAWPSSSFLCIQVQQTRARGDLPADTDSYAIIGSPVCHVEQVPSDMPKFSHSCSFSFFYPGLYYFNIFLSSSPPLTSSLSSSSSLISPSSSSSARTDQLRRTLSAATPPLNMYASSSSPISTSQTSNSNSSGYTSSFPTTTSSSSASSSFSSIVKTPKSLNINSNSSRDNTEMSSSKPRTVQPGWHFGSAVRFEIS